MAHKKNLLKRPKLQEIKLDYRFFIPLRKRKLKLAYTAIEIESIEA